MKCANCNKEIEEAFMGKLKGTHIKGKPYCTECQRSLLEKNSTQNSTKKEEEKKEE